MKRLQIYIEEVLDEALAAQAVREGTSKAALIRRFVAAQTGHPGHAPPDPLDALVGRYDVEPWWGKPVRSCAGGSATPPRMTSSSQPHPRPDS